MQHPGDLQAARALELMAALERYGHALDRLTSSDWDSHLYANASLAFDEITRHVAHLAPLQVSWLEVLISRHELTQSLWKNRGAAASSVEIRTLGARHIDAVERLQRLCVQFLGRSAH